MDQPASPTPPTQLLIERDAQLTAFDSEVWGDSEQLLQAFRRTAYSSLLVRLRQASDFDALSAAIDADSRLQLDARRCAACE
jgi:hypothetical protein